MGGVVAGTTLRMYARVERRYFTTSALRIYRQGVERVSGIGAETLNVGLFVVVLRHNNSILVISLG